MGLLQRARQNCRLTDLVVLAVVRHDVVPQRCEEDRQRLVRALTRVVLRETEAAELIRLIATADADLEPPAGQVVGKGDVLGDAKRVPEREDEDRRPDADLRGLCGEPRRHHQRIRDAPVGGEVVLGDPDRIESEFLGVLCQLDEALEDRRRVLATGCARQEEGSELHDPPLVRDVRRHDPRYERLQPCVACVCRVPAPGARRRYLMRIFTCAELPSSCGLLARSTRM